MDNFQFKVEFWLKIKNSCKASKIRWIWLEYLSKLNRFDFLTLTSPSHTRRVVELNKTAYTYTTRIGILEIDLSFLIALCFKTKFLIKSKMYLIWKFWINNRICVETNKKVHTEFSVRFSMAVYSAVYSVQFTKYLIQPNGVKIQSNSVYWGNPLQLRISMLTEE